MTTLPRYKDRNDGTLWSYADLEEMADDAIAELEGMLKEMVDRKEDAVHYAAQCRRHQEQAEAEVDNLLAELRKRV